METVDKVVRETWLAAADDAPAAGDGGGVVGAREVISID
jgi:hypothetical protein